MEKLRNSFLDSQVRKVDEKNYRITHTVNTKTLDRHGTVVLPKGANIKNFLNNPTVLWSHNGDSSTNKIPIAKCVDISITEKEVEVTTEFNQSDPLAMKVFQAFKDGFLNAWSIGFIPKKYKRYTEENVKELNQEYGLTITKKAVKEAGWYGIYVIYEWELLEYSAVATPANPDALNEYDDAQRTQELVTRGLCTSEDVRNLGQLRQDPMEPVKKEQKSDDPNFQIELKTEDQLKQEAELREAEEAEQKVEKEAKEEADRLFAEKLKKEEEQKALDKELKEKAEKEASEKVQKDSEELQSLREEVTSLKEQNLQLTKRLDVYLETSGKCTKESEERSKKLEDAVKAILKTLEVDNIDDLSLLKEKVENGGNGGFVLSLLSRK